MAIKQNLKQFMKKTKKQCLNSIVWEYFERDGGKATCKLCKSVFVYNGTTSNLFKNDGQIINV